ncbi:MAG TPA: heavy metal-binding domain-containing protein [Cytophagaceae bacterium]|nr:heavy metal-binding domain-containing protein [Cytophagaceae bacterium]
MKKLFTLFFCVAILSVACQSKSDKASMNTTMDTIKTAQGKYFCPMCTGQESDKPGKCSHCGMDLEKKQ